MTVTMAESLLSVVGVYLALGAVFGVAFVSRVQRIDPAARGMPLSARLLVLPGAAVLWPMLAWNWLRGRAPPRA
jgi:hypothetical protein